MDSGILIAVISAAATAAVAAMSFYLTKRHELTVAWRNAKLEHYKLLLSAMSDLAISGVDKDDAHRRFASAVNTIALVAPQHVIDALMTFHDEIKESNRNISVERHDELLVRLLLAVRRDMGLAKGDNASTFKFHLIGASSAPRRDSAAPRASRR